MRARPDLCALLLALSAAVGCRGKGPPAPAPAVSAGVSATPSASAAPPRVAELRAFELRRTLTGVTSADGQSRSALVRRAAARALARIRSAAARDQLLAALADEDSEVAAWAAYGLGESCAGTRIENVRALVAAEASWRNRADHAGALDPLAAIARAVGRCAADTSEAALVDWARARGPEAEDAVFALADVATQRGKLREETFVALLELAAGSASDKPWALALYPLGRTGHLPPSVIDRARDVALARLAEPGPTRVHALRTLGRSDEKAVPALLELLVHPDKGAAHERVEAARALSRLGAPGQKALREAVSKLIPETKDPLKATALVGADFAATVTAIESLTAIEGSRPVIERYAKLEAPAEAPESILRRVSQLRCAGARLLAERNFEEPLLVHCDLTAAKDDANGGPIGARAIVAAIGIEGTEIHGKRHRAWLRYATGDAIRPREEAIALIADHPEIEDVELVLLTALESKYPGVVEAAAEMIAKHPDRITGRDETEHKRGDAKKRHAKKNAAQQAGKALITLLGAKGSAAELEVLTAVIDAAGALVIDGARAPLEELCHSPHEVVRQHSEKALTLLSGGEQKAACPAPDSGRPAPEELGRLLGAKTMLRLETDAGRLILELDPTFAPLAVTRIVELVKSGYYDGKIIHRVVPGFVVQLGSPTADDVGGPEGKAPLACETSPLRFASGSIGVALSGRDTGSSQFFVTLTDQPHLDGQYAWLGSASGPWDALVVGDRISKATIAP